MSQTNLTSLGQNLFAAEVGGLGLMNLATTSDDNEYIFQVLLEILLSGLKYQNKDLADLMDPEYQTAVNDRLTYLGYRFKLEALPYRSGKQVIHYCSVNTDNEFKLNPYHPFNLMKAMQPVPEIYEDFFQRKEYLHQVIAVARIADCILLLRFVQVNVHTENNSLIHRPI